MSKIAVQAGTDDFTVEARVPIESVPLLIEVADATTPKHVPVEIPARASRLQVGQSHENDIVLGDERVSRIHCELRRERGGFWLRDLGSRNGTYVNGLRVESAELRAGAVIALGHSRLKVMQLPSREPSRLIGESVVMCNLRRQIDRLALTALSVLICGETGTGKELVAEAIHQKSGRSGMFVPVNCGAIAKDLIESELFGHERGAFTGAEAKRIGVFQEASGGTLFLDEIGELPLALQSRLLRVLEAKRIRPVGGNREIAVDVRIVAATHVDLRRAVQLGQFREDLFYRLHGAEIATPPLRERGGDIPLLVDSFLRELSDGRAVTLSNDAYAQLTQYTWPGNVRELRHALTRAVALGGPVIEASELAFSSMCRDDLAAPGSNRDSDSDSNSGLVQVTGRAYFDIERDVIRQVLLHHAGNRRQAAQALGIPKSTLCDKVRRFGIVIEES